MIIQVCLQPQGNFVDGALLKIFSNADNYTTPFITNVPISELLAPECPLLIENVPDGTTMIKIIDEVEFNCVFLPLNDFDICEDCNFYFETIEDDGPQTNVQVGLLKSDTCFQDFLIPGYRIEWLDEFGDVAFTSGQGDFEYEYSHPISGLPVLPGTYTPYLTHVYVHYGGDPSVPGYVYSSDINYGGITQYDFDYFIVPLFECLDYEITIEALTCSNGNTQGAYSHSLLFNNTSNVPPNPVSQYFIIDNSVNYLAWQFHGFQFSDELKIIFHGTNYDDPILLEWYSVGNTEGTVDYGINPGIMRYGDNKPFRKVTNLTNINIEVGDYMEFIITPSTLTLNTKWQLYFKCLETFGCYPCFLMQNITHQISLSTINFSSVGQGGICDIWPKVNYTLVPCDLNYCEQDLKKYFAPYLETFPNGGGLHKIDITGEEIPRCNVSVSPRFDWLESQCQTVATSRNWSFRQSGYYWKYIHDVWNHTCESVGGTFWVDKSPGHFSITTTSQDFYNEYMTHWNAVSDLFEADGQLPFSDVSRFNWLQLRVLYNNSSPDIECGDNFSIFTVYIQCGAQFTTTTSGGVYTMTWDYDLITEEDADLENPCQYSLVESWYKDWNNGWNRNYNNYWSTFTSQNNNGIKDIGPMSYRRATPDVVSYGQEFHRHNNWSIYNWFTHKSLMETVPRSTVEPYEPIPYLSATTCPNLFRKLSEWRANNCTTTCTGEEDYLDGFYGKVCTTFHFKSQDEALGYDDRYDWWQIDTICGETILMATGNTLNVINDDYFIS